jgi:hypothetical protein
MTEIEKAGPEPEPEVMELGSGLRAHLILRSRGRTLLAADRDIRRLRLEMAAAHPDRGGSNEEFRAARERYEAALAARDALGKSA